MPSPVGIAIEPDCSARPWENPGSGTRPPVRTLQPIRSVDGSTYELIIFAGRCDEG